MKTEKELREALAAVVAKQYEYTIKYILPEDSTLSSAYSRIVSRLEAQEDLLLWILESIYEQPW